MPTIDVECSECAMILPIEEDLLNTEMKCPKCKSMFVAEKSGGLYAIVEAPRPAPTRSSPSPSFRPNPAKPSSSKSSPSPKPQPEPSVETETERRLRERMEKWADE